MATVNIHEAKTHLSRLIEQAAAGETITIAKGGKPMVKLTAPDAPVAGQCGGSASWRETSRCRMISTGWDRRRSSGYSTVISRAMPGETARQQARLSRPVLERRESSCYGRLAMTPERSLKPAPLKLHHSGNPDRMTRLDKIKGTELVLDCRCRLPTPHGLCSTCVRVPGPLSRSGRPPRPHH